MQSRNVHWDALSPLSTPLSSHFNNRNCNRTHHICKAVVREYKSTRSLELCTSKQQPTGLDALTHCQRCLKQFQEPTTLSCGFTLCYQCLPSPEPYQCFSFSCLRSHDNNYKPNVLLESILSQLNSYNPNNQEFLKRLLDCSICLTLLTEPVTTQCGHTFCKECLIRTMIDLKNRTCPFCRHELTRIGKVNQIICGWLDFLNNGMVFPPEDNQDQIAYSQHMPFIQVTSPVVFPTEYCLIHITGDHRSLLKRMIKNPHQKHYAVCVFAKDLRSAEALYDHGVMLQINHVEHSPDLRHFVVQATGLFRIGISQFTVDEDNCYTGDVIRLDDTEKGEFGLECRSRNDEKRLIPGANTNDSTSTTTQRKLTRLHPCSMHSSNSMPKSNQLSTMRIQASNYPKPWANLMYFGRPSSKSIFSTFTQPTRNFIHNNDSNATTRVPDYHPYVRSWTPTALPIAVTSNLRSPESLLTQNLHPNLVQYLSHKCPNSWLTQYELYMQRSDRNSLIWWLANTLPLEQEEKLQLLSMQSFRERAIAIISFLDKWK